MVADKVSQNLLHTRSRELCCINDNLDVLFSDPSVESAAPAIENMADAVTHARFVGTDPSSDEVILMKILHVCMIVTTSDVFRYCQ